MLRLSLLPIMATLFLLPWQAQADQSDLIYLVAKLDIDGTTYNEVVIFQDDVIDELKDCKREVMYGRSGGWQVYSHITNAVRGFTYSTTYTCASGGQRFSGWDRSGAAPRNQIFSVTIKDEQLLVRTHASYSKCMAWVRQRGGETRNQYCGRSAQKILK